MSIAPGPHIVLLLIHVAEDDAWWKPDDSTDLIKPAKEKFAYISDSLAWPSDNFYTR
jgi:hypothetical protein